MKSTLWVLSTAVLIPLSACSNTAPTAPTGTGGSATGNGGSVGTGTGNSTGLGGSEAGGGTSGNVTGLGGTSTGGTTGNGGSTAVGGSTGNGGSIPVGGSTGNGGASANGGGGGNLCNNGDCTAIVGDWDGALDKFPCTGLSGNETYDCPNACPGGNGKTTSFTYHVGGAAGTIYNVALEAKGIVEVYPYGGSPVEVSGYTYPIIGQGGLNNLFASGGTQAPSGNGNDYNTYELDVSPPVPGLTNVAGSGNSAHNVYYLNYVPSATENPHTSQTTQHLTFTIDDVATIKIPAGATVTFTSFDSNCVEVQNCGVQGGTACKSPQTVSFAGANPAAPAFSQPYVDSVGGHGQFVFFDIKNVTVAQ
jgi:hypothetical protein